jgi:hypothetical protein
MYIVRAVRDGKVVRCERETSKEASATIRRLTNLGWRIRATEGDDVVFDSTHCRAAAVAS